MIRSEDRDSCSFRYRESTLGDEEVVMASSRSKDGSEVVNIECLLDMRASVVVNSQLERQGAIARHPRPEGHSMGYPRAAVCFDKVAMS